MKELVFEKDGLELNYTDVGKGQPLLFLHGAGFQMHTYRDAIELLAKNFRVIAPDIPCFGRSSVPDEVWDFGDYAQFFCGFIDFLRLEKLLLVGHSFGGGVALQIAARDKRVSRLILIDSAGIPLEYPFGKLIFLATFKSAKALLFYRNRKKTLATICHFFRYVVRRLPRVPQIMRIVQKSMYSEYSWSMRQPTFLFWGTHDEVFPRRYAEKMNKLIKGSILQFVEGNHDWCVLMPEKLGELVNKTMQV